MYPNQNPNDYRQPTQPPQPDRTQAWFKTMLDADAPHYAAPKKSRKPLVLFILAVLFIVSSVTGTFLYLSKPTIAACLMNDDFKRLTGTTLEDTVDPKLGLYSESFDFNNNTTSLNDSEKLTAFANKLARFIKETPDSTSVIIKISVSYERDDQAQLSLERIEKVKQILLDAGVPDEAMLSIKPQKVDQVGEVVSGYPVYVSILSAESCQ